MSASGLRLFPRQAHPQDTSESQLHRQGTLLSTHPAHNAAEQLSALLGDSNSRLKRGAAAPQSLNLDTLAKAPDVPLEQAKYRARVKVDIQLASDILVQGGSLRGNFKLRIRKASTKEPEIWLSCPKIRIVGYETVGSQRHIFYQSTALLPDDSVSMAFLRNHSERGYFAAREGVHVIPFDLFTVVESEYGTPKGVFHHATCTVQYIAIASVNVKTFKKRTIAHFYRHCQVFPRLNPVAVLAHSKTPLQIESVPNASDNDDTMLTVAISRKTWVAGQHCHIQLFVANHSKKDIKTVSLNLVRTLSTYRPCPDGSEDVKSTTTKIIAQATLSMAQPSSRGCASAKGWWTGVPSGRSQEFVHYLIIPVWHRFVLLAQHLILLQPDAITISRGRLLQVQYEIQAQLPSGVSVAIPIDIVNFLSLDPPSVLRIGNTNASYLTNSFQSYSLPSSAHSSRPPTPPINLDPDSSQEIEEILEDVRLSDIPEDDPDDFVHSTIVDDDQEEIDPTMAIFSNLYKVSGISPQKEIHENSILENQEGDFVEFYGPRSNSPTKTVVRRPANPGRGSSFQERVRQKLDERERRKSLGESPLQVEERNVHAQKRRNSEGFTETTEQSPLRSKPQRILPSYFDAVYASPSVRNQTELTESPSACSRLSTLPRPLPQLPHQARPISSHARSLSGEFYGVQIPMSHSAAILATLEQEYLGEAKGNKSTPVQPQMEPLISPTKSVKEKIREMEQRMRNEVY